VQVADFKCFSHGWVDGVMGLWVNELMGQLVKSDKPCLDSPHDSERPVSSQDAARRYKIMVTNSWSNGVAEQGSGDELTAAARRAQGEEVGNRCSDSSCASAVKDSCQFGFIRIIIS
jgi:hypothetical protein